VRQVGDVTLGHKDIEIAESLDDFGMGNVVLEHAIDHVAMELGQPGDFAFAGMRPGGLERVR
jgi:hypothetical protein